MREIAIKKSVGPRPISVMSYGPTRAGKTRWASTFPRPLFLSDATEKGWESIETAPPESFFEPDRTPLVWAMETPADVHTAIDKVGPLIASGDVKTIVLDSLTFYADLYLNKVIGDMQKAGKVDLRTAYGALGTHLGDLRIKIEKLGVNVVWLALERTPEEGERMSVPMVPGKASMKFSASCSYIFFHKTVVVDKQRVYEMHTQPSEAFIAGGRDAGLLPDVITNPNYREFAGLLGILPSAQTTLPLQPVVTAAPPTARPVPARPVVSAASVKR